MRIIICVTNDIVTDQRVQRIAQTLLKLPSEVVIAGIKRRQSLVTQKSNTGFRRFRMIFLKGPLFYMEFNIRLFFYLLFTRAEIMIANDLDSLPAAYLAGMLKRRPVVYDSHEYFTELPELVDRGFIRQIWLNIEKLILPRIKYAYTVNESIATRYNQQYGISMQVIRNLPVKITAFPPGPTLKKDTEKLIIYQGALNIGRGLEIAISAMKYMDNCKLIIAGGGYLEKKLKALVSNLNLTDRVQFTGLVRPDELIKITAQADFGISLEENKGLNYYYALPNKLFDYIQARIPVLVSDLPEMAAIVNRYEIGLVIRTTDPLELSEAFKSMLYSMDSIIKWKHNLANAAKELCWENEEIKLLEIYHRVVTDHAFLKEDK